MEEQEYNNEQTKFEKTGEEKDIRKDDTLVEEVPLEETQQPKRGKGRPSKYGRYRINVNRKNRVPVGGFRSILTVEGKDPDFHYYWEIDSSETGPNIMKRLRAGYEFVREEENVIVGEASVFQSEAVGSVYRVPNGDGRYLFLMRIPMEWYKEDMEAIQQQVDQREEALYGPEIQGEYGRSLSIDYGK